MSSNKIVCTSNQYSALQKHFDNISKSERKLKKNIVIVQLDENAKMPSRSEPGAAGYDLFSRENITLDSLERSAISTGIRMVIPEGNYGRIAPRSGLALNYGIDVMGGVIDSSYRGEIKVILINLSKNKFEITQGMKIAQIIFEKISTPQLCEASVLIHASQRGESGFGSSGF